MMFRLDDNTRCKRSCEATRYVCRWILSEIISAVKHGNVPWKIVFLQCPQKGVGNVY